MAIVDQILNELTPGRCGYEKRFSLLLITLWNHGCRLDLSVGINCRNRSWWYICVAYHNQYLFELEGTAILNGSIVSYIVRWQTKHPHNMISWKLNVWWEQECIQVRCVPSAAVAVCLGGMSGRGGCLATGCLAVGLCLPMERCTPPPVDRQTLVKTQPFRNYCCGW